MTTPENAEVAGTAEFAEAGPALRLANDGESVSIDNNMTYRCDSVIAI